jgi:hypothetical protein
MSGIAYQLMTDYLDAKNENAFVESVQKSQSLSQNDAITYQNELGIFLETVNKKEQRNPNNQITVEIPPPKITKHYNFGDANFTVNYSSNALLQHLHPHLEHGSLDTIMDVNTVIDIFEAGNLLYLFNNKFFVGSYEIENFHFLQGKFSMELLTSIYNNTEADWMATFHASTVCNDKEAIMIIGDSGHGKSTLSAILMAHGWDLLADDFTPMLANNQQLYRFPAAISIKKGAFELMSSLFEDFKTLEPKMSSSKPISIKFLPPLQPFKTSQKNFECHKIVKVKYAADITSELKECTPEDILQTFIPDSWISPQPEHSKGFLNWLGRLKFYELSYSNNEVAITKFKELFEL